MLDIFNLTFEIHSPGFWPLETETIGFSALWLSLGLNQQRNEYVGDQRMKGNRDGGIFIPGSFPTMDWLFLSTQDQAPGRQPSLPPPKATARPFRPNNALCCY